MKSGSDAFRWDAKLHKIQCNSLELRPVEKKNIESAFHIIGMIIHVYVLCSSTYF